MDDNNSDYDDDNIFTFHHQLLVEPTVNNLKIATFQIPKILVEQKFHYFFTGYTLRVETAYFFWGSVGSLL